MARAFQRSCIGVAACRPRSPAMAVAAAVLVAVGTGGAHAADALVCAHDATVTERFIPVELLTGLPLPAPESQALTFGEVDRTYPFVDVLPDGSVGSGEVALKGPMKWSGYRGIEFEVYERKVPRAHERFALTEDKSAIGRVYDQRFGNAYNEGKFPVGKWQQGQKKSYDTLYNTRSAVSSLEIEKLSCTYDGIAGALQYRWRTNNGLDYGYIYAPGKGVVQVFTYKGGR
jgi:hypothetical protein